jgi:hypothetical protein
LFWIIGKEGIFIKIFIMKQYLFTLLLVVAFIGCKKDDDPVPTAAEKQAVLLAGKSGESKTWILTGFEIDNQDVFEGLCEYDNEYTFFNNAGQTFEGKEGEEECIDWVDLNQNDIIDEGEVGTYGPDIEGGIWAFTIDGKSVIISSARTESNFAIFSFFIDQGRPLPAKIITLTDTDFNLEMEVTFGFGSDNQPVKMSFKVLEPNS